MLLRSFGKKKKIATVIQLADFTEYRKGLQRRAKGIVDGTQYPPQIEKTNFSCFANCYGFALNLPLNDYKKEFLIPGCISDHKIDSSIFGRDELIARTKKDLDFLGLKYREIDLKQKDNFSLTEKEYAIAIFIDVWKPFHDEGYNFHFLRTNSEGIWIGKDGWENKFSTYEIIEEGLDSTLSLVAILAIRKK